MGETSGLLLVARPHCVLVDDGPESSSRRHPLGHVVRRRQVLSGELWGLGPKAYGFGGGHGLELGGGGMGSDCLPLWVCVGVEAREMMRLHWCLTARMPAESLPPGHPFPRSPSHLPSGPLRRAVIY